MKTTFYILCIFTLFLPTVIASKYNWKERYPKLWQSQLYMILRGGFSKEDRESASEHVPQFIAMSESIVDVQKILKDASKTPLDMYGILIETLHPGFAELAKDYYKEQRSSSNTPDDFGEFDVKFYYKLKYMNASYISGVEWSKLSGLSSKEEVMCEAAFFYDLVDFERAITCLDAVPPVATLTCKAFSNFVADMYFGEAKRPDFSYEGDLETRKWLDDMVKKYELNYFPQTTSLMRRFTRNLRDKGRVDNNLWNNYMRAMMTVHLSAVLLWIKVKCLQDMYNYLANNNISDEYVFASIKLEPLQTGQTVQGAHAFLRTFKLDPDGETASMGIINSGDGIQFHDNASFNLSELPDTISGDPHATSVTRFIPFMVFGAVPRSDWVPAYTIADNLDIAYFKYEQGAYTFSYKPWQYVDYQRAATCSVMSLWSALYWFERESQQKLESFRLQLYLEAFTEAVKELIKLRTELEELESQKFESAGDEHKWNELQSKIKEKSEIEDDYLRFFSVGFNSAIRSIRYLHTDPFKQGLDMTAVMQSYADFYESEGSKIYWQLVKPNIDDLYNSTYFRILNPTYPLPAVAPTISIKERGCVNEVNQAIESGDPFNFVKAVISGTDLGCQSKEFLESIHSGINILDLQTHHQDLILRALFKEARSLRGGRMSIIRFAVKLVNDDNFKLFPIYDVPPTESIDFAKNIYQTVLFEDDAEMKQFAANCAAFDLLGKNVLAAAYDLVKSATKSLSQIETRVSIGDTEEYKLHKNLVQRVASELQSMDHYIRVLHISNLIWNAEQTGIAGYINLFIPSEGWNQDDYSLLENATKGSGSFETPIKEYIQNLKVGQELASKYLPSLPSNLTNVDHVHADVVSRAIEANSALNFVKAVSFVIWQKCKSESFILAITLGLRSLKLRPHHQDLILRALAWHEDASQMLNLINELVAKHGFKLFSTDNTPPNVVVKMTDYDFFIKTLQLQNEMEAQQFAADLNADRSTVATILTTCAEHDNLTGLRLRFIEHTFKELQEMRPHLHAYHLSRLISQKVLKLEDFNSGAFKPSKEWYHYDFALIEHAVMRSFTREESGDYNKIFGFPKVYYLNTNNVRDESGFRLMSANPSDEILKEYAKSLCKQVKDIRPKFVPTV